MDTTDITLYFVGHSEKQAREGMPFDSIESADSYAQDEGGEIYEAIATIDFSTLHKVG